jgi:hypothetical protein
LTKEVRWSDKKEEGKLRMRKRRRSRRRKRRQAT